MRSNIKQTQKDKSYTYFTLHMQSTLNSGAHSRMMVTKAKGWKNGGMMVKGYIISGRMRFFFLDLCIALWIHLTTVYCTFQIY